MVGLWVSRKLEQCAVVGSVVVGGERAGGMADMNGALQIEMRGRCGQVIGIVVHIVTVAHLRRTAVAAAVLRYDAIALIEEEQHLRLPVIGRQRPTMAEHDGLTFAPELAGVGRRDGRVYGFRARILAIGGPQAVGLDEHDQVGVAGCCRRIRSVARDR
jgi:hypothetical protein